MNPVDTISFKEPRSEHFNPGITSNPVRSTVLTNQHISSYLSTSLTPNLLSQDSPSAFKSVRSPSGRPRGFSEPVRPDDVGIDPLSLVRSSFPKSQIRQTSFQTDNASASNQGISSSILHLDNEYHESTNSVHTLNKFNKIFPPQVPSDQLGRRRSVSLALSSNTRADLDLGDDDISLSLLKGSYAAPSIDHQNTWSPLDQSRKFRSHSHGSINDVGCVPGTPSSMSSTNPYDVDEHSLPASSQECSNLFVNYLPQGVDDQALYKLFEPFGPIDSCKVMLDLNTQRSRCFGFVKFANLEHAKHAMKEMNGLRLEHKTLIVKYANTPDTTSVGTPSNNVYIKGLPANFTSNDLRTLFERYGEIEDCRVLVDMTTLASRGIAFVRFCDVMCAQAAIDVLNNSFVAGSNKPILVKFADTEDERTQRKLRQARRKKLQQMYMQQQVQANMGSPHMSPHAMPQTMSQLWDGPMFPTLADASPLYRPVSPYAYAPTAMSPVHMSQSPFMAGSFSPHYMAHPQSLLHPPPHQYHQHNSDHSSAPSPSLSPSPQFPEEPEAASQPSLSVDAVLSGMGGMGMGAISTSPPPSPPKVSTVKSTSSPRHYRPEPPRPSMNSSLSPPPLSPMLPPVDHRFCYPMPAHSQSPPTFFPSQDFSLWMPPQPPSRTELYVAHLPTEYDEEDLVRLFKPFAQPSWAKVIRDHTTNVSRGYGFVKMLNMADAIAVINALNHQIVGNKALVVEFKKSA